MGGEKETSFNAEGDQHQHSEQHAKAITAVIDAAVFSSVIGQKCMDLLKGRESSDEVIERWTSQRQSSSTV